MIHIRNPELTEIHCDCDAIGDGTTVGSFTLIHDSAKIGENCMIGSHCNIYGTIGKNASIQTGCHITKGVIIGDDSFLGPGVITMNDKFMLRDSSKLTPPIIGKRCRIGGGTMILPGVKIGDDVLIGAGSVITKSIPNGKRAYGNPASIVIDNDEADIKEFGVDVGGIEGIG